MFVIFFHNILIASFSSFTECRRIAYIFQTITLECSLSKCIHKWNNQIVSPSFEQVLDTLTNSTTLDFSDLLSCQNSEELFG